MRRLDDGLVVLIVVAAVLVGWLGAYRYVDEQRDHLNSQLVDLLHLSVLVQKQAVRCLQPNPSGGTAPALQAEVESRLRYLVDTGMAPHNEADLATAVDAFQADLHQPGACPTGGAAPASGADADAHVLADLGRSAARLDAAEQARRSSTSHDDVVLDAGSAVASVVPPLGVAALLLLRWRRRGRSTGSGGQ